MKKYRKKPAVIEALQWTGKNVMEIESFVGPSASFIEGKLVISTLEGDHLAIHSDFIIKGVAGGFYPCKKRIFHAMYEEVL